MDLWNTKTENRDRWLHLMLLPADLPDCLNQSDEFPTTSSLGVCGRHPRLATRFLLRERVRETQGEGQRRTRETRSRNPSPLSPTHGPARSAVCIMILSATPKCHN